MKYLSAVILAVGLSSDVFFASFSQGLAIRKLTCKKLLGISMVLTAVQGGCAALAYYLSEQTGWYCEWMDHWISFFLLVLVGAMMLLRSYHDEETDQKESAIRYLFVVLISIAVSIDALAITTTDTFSDINCWIGTIIIAAETFVITSAGLWLGHKIGSKYRYKSEFSGGILLLVLAVKILLLGVLR